MRTVYIDVLIAVNIFIDFFLILCTKKFLHLGTSTLRIILGGAFGGIFSLAALVPRLPFGINIALDIFTAGIIVFAVFGRCSIKNYIKRVSVYFFISFAFCGIMIFIYTSFKPAGMEIYNDTVYFNISPIFSSLSCISENGDKIYSIKSSFLKLFKIKFKTLNINLIGKRLFKVVLSSI